MITDLSKLKPAVVPADWDELTAIVLKDEKEILIVRTPSDDREELLQVADALETAFEGAGIRYLVVPYSIEFLHFQTKEGWWKRVWHRINVICGEIIDNI